MPNVVVHLVGLKRLFCFDFAFTRTLGLVVTKRCWYNVAEEVNNICCKTQYPNFLFNFCQHWAWMKIFGVLLSQPMKAYSNQKLMSTILKNELVFAKQTAKLYSLHYWDRFGSWKGTGHRGQVYHWLFCKRVFWIDLATGHVIGSTQNGQM